MMNDYQKRGAYTTLEEYVLAKTGGRIDELDRNRKYEVGGLSHAAAMLQHAKRRGTAVYLYTDSDLDGSGAMYIGCRIAERLHLKRGANFFPSIQNNAEHGCGLSLKYIDQVRPGSLLITGDLDITFTKLRARKPTALAVG